jgi:hypothetical protein
MDPDPDPTPDPTTFFNDFKDLINKNFHIFSYNLPTCTSSAVLKGRIQTSGFGSGRPKNIRILRIRIPNTDLLDIHYLLLLDLILSLSASCLALHAERSGLCLTASRLKYH